MILIRTSVQVDDWKPILLNDQTPNVTDGVEADPYRMVNVNSI